MSLTAWSKAAIRRLAGTAHPFIVHAALMERLHARYGIIPDYERILEGAYQPLIKQGDTVIDVGAHTGRHTRVFLDLVGPRGCVLAFEPLPDAAAELCATCPGARVFTCALAEHSGRSLFVHARGTPQESGLRQRTYNRPDLADPSTIEVEVRRLDEFCEQIDGRLSFLKVDVEGAELSCLRGATKMLRRFRPVVSVEYGSPGYTAYGETARALFDFAASADYVLCDLFGALCPDLTSWLSACDRAYWDWLLVPRERRVEVAGAMLAHASSGRTDQ